MRNQPYISEIHGIGQFRIHTFSSLIGALQTHPCNENRVFPVKFFSQGKPHRENPVSITGMGLQCRFCNDYLLITLLLLVTQISSKVCSAEAELVSVVGAIAYKRLRQTASVAQNQNGNLQIRNKHESFTNHCHNRLDFLYKFSY